MTRVIAKPSDNARVGMLNAYRFAVVLAALSVGLLSPTSVAERLSSWTRYSYGAPPGVPFTLAYVGCTDHTLSAAGWYRYSQGRDPVMLHGEKKPDGMFRPIVTYEVATEGVTKWRKILADVDQPSSESITVSPDKPSVRISVDMEPFRKAIGVYRYGRLVLENGDAAILEMDDLLPTADGSDESGNFKDDLIQTDEDRKRQGFTDAWLAQPANLSTLTSLAGRLTGDFWFSAESGEAVSLKGTKTLDGDFWATVTLQAANADGAWQIVGESKHDGVPGTIEIPDGKAERLRVLLTDYKALIGKFKFGRIVFSNGQSGVFSIDFLDPKKWSLEKTSP